MKEVIKEELYKMPLPSFILSELHVEEYSLSSRQVKIYFVENLK
jgi:hypothetical protein